MPSRRATVTRLGAIACAALVASCTDTEKLETKVTKLEEEVAALRAAREDASRQLERVLSELDFLERKLDETTRAAPRPSYPPRPSRPSRPRPDADKTYSIALAPLDPIDGPADALVTIVEGYEYACPFCEKARGTLDELKRRYGNDLRVAYKQLVVHPQTATAPALAICAAHRQDRFAAMDRMLWEDGFKARSFDRNGCWDEAGGCPVVERFARKAGLGVARLRKDMAGGCAAWLRDNAAAFQRLGVAATPSFFINGRYVSGAMPVDSFVAVIDEELAKARARVAQGTPRAEYYARAVVDEGLRDLDP